MGREAQTRRPAAQDGRASEEKEIIRGFLQNDPEEIARISRWAMSVASHRSWGFESCDDIVQTALLALVRNLREGRFVEGNLEGYVRRIAKNLCLTSYRRSRVRRGQVSLDEEREPSTKAAGGLDPERRTLLVRILERLDPRCREIILLAYLYGFSRREIAQRQEITETAAKVRLFRCLERARTAQSWT